MPQVIPSLQHLVGELPPPGPDGPPEGNWETRRDWFRKRLQTAALRGVTEDEIEAHFAFMPGRYWERVSESDLLWGLATIHGFLETTSSNTLPPTTPCVRFRDLPERGWTQVMLSTWDRHGLLAKTAAAFKAAGLNVIQAEVYTRSDNVVLDVFRVSEPDGQTPASSARLRDMTFILDGALAEPPRFASVWACSRHKYLAPPESIAPRIGFDNESPDATLIQLEASDRLGLLYDTLQAMADSGLNIIEAMIRTENSLARNTFRVLDGYGQRLLEPERQADLIRKLESAISVEGTGGS